MNRSTPEFVSPLPAYKGRLHAVIRALLLVVPLLVLRVVIQITAEHEAIDDRVYTSTPLLTLLASIAFGLSYILLVRFIEGRPADELSAHTAVRQLSLGVILNTVLFGSVVATMWLAGSYAATLSDIPSDAFGLAAFYLFIAVSEEIVFRGILFRLLQEWLGSIVAVIASAGAFAASHIANPDATWIALVGLGIEAGVLYGALFIVTRSLWAPIGAHFAWNLLEGPVYGFPVSGFDSPHLLASRVSGPAWLSGGAFGPEAGVPAIAFCAIAASLLLTWAAAHGKFIRWNEQSLIRKGSDQSDA